MSRAYEPQDPVSFADRLDPSGATREQLKLASVATSPLVSPLLRALGVPSETIDALREAVQSVQHLDRGDETARVLVEHGWVFFDLAPADASHRAAQLFAQGHAEEADAFLIDAWNEHDYALLRMAKHRVSALYWTGGEDDVPSEVGQQRADLIDDAIEMHRSGKYSGSVPILLAQMDGIVADWTEDGRHLFRRNRNGTPAAQVVDDTTLAGHPDVLLAFSDRLTERCDTTEVTGALARHGIAHGRELGYDTLTNSTKLFAALLAVITWAQPKARDRLRRDAEEREARYAGSKERDEHGRRLDRRGFSTAKETLYSVALTQKNHWDKTNSYSSELAVLDPGSHFFKTVKPEVAASPNGRVYWSWLRTPANYVLGVGGIGGDGRLWYYGADDPPHEGPPNRGWHEDGSSPEHPDWR